MKTFWLFIKTLIFHKGNFYTPWVLEEMRKYEEIKKQVETP